MGEIFVAVLWAHPLLHQNTSDTMHCNPSRKLKLALMSVALGSATILAACGGGNLDARVASVSAITADSAPAYDRVATFNVAGTNLDIGLTTSALGCSRPELLSGGTATAMKVSCIPDRDGDISVSLHVGTGEVLKTASFTVPKPQVKMETSLGGLLIELEPAKAPITVKNFLEYAQDGFFENTVFHRVYSAFLAEGGAFTFLGTNYVAKAPTRPPIALERTTITGLSNISRTIGMARTNVPDSATAQFYINFADNVFLDAQRSTDGNGYAVFGTVVSTADTNSEATLAAVKAVQVMNNGSEMSLPLNPPTISAITRVR
jgi:cyclophilin family peptidyl-prolyl cis-trans isomerase